MICLKSLWLLPALLREALAYKALSESTLQSLPSPGSDFDIHSGSILAPILRPRVPGTPGSDEVLDHFVDFFTQNLPDWKLSFQNSTSVTPTSGGAKIPFRNLIATRDPPWIRNDGEVGRLALVAHYDSKLTPEGFIGATDSAAPCAMILHAARSIDKALTKKWAATQEAGDHELEEHKGIQVLLLDGEEAFMTWTHTDSLYGARALAEEWETTEYAAWSAYRSPLATIDLFVLLDLLGAENPRVPSYYKTTHWAYQHMANLEERLRNARLFKSMSKHAAEGHPDSVFLQDAAKPDASKWYGQYIEDDHIPFMQRGVDVLHLIPMPFPQVWHNIDDDGEHLHTETVEDWALLTTAFAAEWMELEGYFDTGLPGQKRSYNEDEKTEL